MKVLTDGTGRWGAGLTLGSVTKKTDGWYFYPQFQRKPSRKGHPDPESAIRRYLKGGYMIVRPEDSSVFTDHGGAPTKCERCQGTGGIDTPFSDSDPCCPDCDGEGVIQDEKETSYIIAESAMLAKAVRS